MYVFTVQSVTVKTLYLLKKKKMLKKCILFHNTLMSQYIFYINNVYCMKKPKKLKKITFIKYNIVRKLFFIKIQFGIALVCEKKCQTYPLRKIGNGTNAFKKNTLYNTVQPTVHGLIRNQIFFGEINEDQRRIRGLLITFKRETN